MSDAARDPLEFEPPPEGNPQLWDQAEKACLRFPEQFLEKARELNECRRDLKKLCEDNDRQTSFVIRSLITQVTNCKLALTQDGAGQTPAEASLDTTTLASIERGLLHILEELGVARVELLGRTYENVEVDGEKIDDPFQILEATQKGKSSEIEVREVVSDLWVRRQHGAIQVVARGKVNC